MIRNHQRAILAHQHVSAVESSQSRKYGSMCHKLPILVHAEGLAPALHFVAARGTHAQRLILDHLARQLADAGLVERAGADSLLAASREADLSALQAMTREVQRCLYWYKSFAKSVLDVDASDEGGPE